jgi:Aminoglycoside/hydroxyurea antibiotic resistance kinase
MSTHGAKRGFHLSTQKLLNWGMPGSDQDPRRCASLSQLRDEGTPKVIRRKETPRVGATRRSDYNEGMALQIPKGLAASCRKSTDRAAWLDGLPELLGKLELEWSVRLGAPFDGEDVSCSYVAAVERADGTPAVLKIGMPHMEGHHEIHGLRFWCGDPTERLLTADDDLGAMLLERCEPGTTLRELEEQEQDRVISGLLRRLWRKPTKPRRLQTDHHPNTREDFAGNARTRVSLDRCVRGPSIRPAHQRRAALDSVHLGLVTVYDKKNL